MSPLNMVFCFSGCRLFSRGNHFLRFLDNFLATLLFLSHSFVMFVSFPRTIDFNVAMEVTSTANAFISISFILLMRLQRNKITALIYSSEQFLSQKDKKRIFYFSLVISLLYLLNVIGIVYIRTETIIVFWSKLDQNFLVIRKISVVLETFNVPCCWMYGACPLLILCMKLINLEENKVLSDMIRDSQNQVMKYNPIEISLFLKKMLFKKDLLMSRFSFLPCLWFLFVFVKSILAITITETAIAASKESIYYLNPIMKLIISQLIIMAILLVYLMFECEKLVNDSRDRLIKLTGVITARNENTKWIIVHGDIERAKEYSYRAWDMFDINKSLLLSFTGSLLTFTVLFVQKLNSIAKPYYYSK